MSLRQQALLSWTIATIFFATLVVLTCRWVLVGHAQQIEMSHASQDLVRVRKAIESELAALDTTARDYASWDLTYGFMARPTSEFVMRELSDSTLRTIRVDALLLLDTARKLVCVKSLNHVSERSIGADDMNDFAEAVTSLMGPVVTDTGVSGVIRTKPGVFLFAARPILNSEHQGPSRGILIMARRIDDELLRQVSRTVDLPLVILETSQGNPMENASGGISLVESDDGYIVGLIAIEGVDSTPAIILQSQFTEIFRPKILRAQWYLVAILFAIGSIVGAGTLAWIERVVLRPVAALGETFKGISESEDLTRRVPMLPGRRNEMSMLTARVNLMLDRLERSKNELTKAKQAIEHQAAHDGLTGLLNRAAIRKTILREISRAKRGHSPVALLAIDIDHFKQINDTYGHPAGDEVLRTVALVIQSLLRPYDSLGRTGGEEFLVVAPDCDVEGASAIAERIRNSVSAAKTLTGKQSLSVTISVGVCSSSELGIEELYQLADAALYDAKRNGRNRVAIASATLQLPQPTVTKPVVN